MGQYLSQYEKDAEAQLAKVESDLLALSKSKEWEAVKSTADITGIIDPTPTSDVISMGMSIAESDWIGAILSGVSIVPYFGDVIAKPVKLARAAKVVMKIEEQAAALAKAIAHLKSGAVKIAQQKMAAAAERARRVKEAGEAYAKNAKCQPCLDKLNRFGTQLPATGTWKGEKGAKGERGNSLWVSDGKPPTTLNYKEGYPDFSTSNPSSLYPKGEGKVEIQMKGDTSDFTRARNAMRDKLGDPKWPPLPGDYAPKGYTWHHVEDGATMQLVASEIHDKAKSGAAHAGGASIVSGKNSEF